MKKKAKSKYMLSLTVLVSYMLTITLVLLGLYSLVGAGEVQGEVQGTGEDTEYIPRAPSADEMSAVWIATVSNINYPSARGLSEGTLRAELDAIVQSIADLGANAVFFQVRPCSDALYDSDIFPQSHYVSGERGRGASGEFDSLGYLIEIAHATGIEVHAWINPVRVLPGSPSDPARMDELCEGEPAYLHPEWVSAYAAGRL